MDGGDHDLSVPRPAWRRIGNLSHGAQKSSAPWDHRPAMIELPPATRAWLVARIERSWPEPAPVVATIPEALPAGEVHKLAGGGPFGLMLHGRLDEVGGRVALEVLENDRMSGESYYRVWDDGALEPLEPAPRLGYSWRTGASDAERAAAEAAYQEHNRRAYELLAERGFIGT
jgi:hypothetical protein